MISKGRFFLVALFWLMVSVLSLFQLPILLSGSSFQVLLGCALVVFIATLIVFVFPASVLWTVKKEKDYED